MEPGGRVFVVEMVSPDDGAASMAQLVNVNMMALLSGRERTRAEYATLFERAGLRRTPAFGSLPKHECSASTTALYYFYAARAAWSQRAAVPAVSGLVATPEDP